MKDTSPEMEERYRRMLMALAPEERLRRGCNMFQTAKAIVIASIKNELGPHITESELRCRLFLRLYGTDFSEPTRLKILSRLAQPLA